MAGAITVIVFGVITAVALFTNTPPGRVFLLSLALITAWVLCLGKSLSMNRWWGALINNRNLMSMSRLQTLMWSVVVFAGLLVIMLLRLRHGVSDPLDVKVDQHLWWALGISLGSLAGTPMILDAKKSQTPSDSALDKTAGQLKEDKGQIDDNRVGTLYSNQSPDNATFTDMFQGDEVGNAAQLDIAKIQMFVLTVALIVSYAAALWAAVASSVHFTDQNWKDFTLPVLSGTQIALLGVSHAGYLAAKTVSKTQTQEQQN